jgi:hypothetical protein
VRRRPATTTGLCLARIPFVLCTCAAPDAPASLLPAAAGGVGGAAHAVYAPPGGGVTPPRAADWCGSSAALRALAAQLKSARSPDAEWAPVAASAAALIAAEVRAPRRGARRRSPARPAPGVRE